MMCNGSARRDPDAIVPLDVVQKPLQGGETAWTPDQAAVQSYRHHLGGMFALGVEDVEGIFQIGVELVTAVDALCRGKTHVVGVEGIGHDQMRPDDAVRKIDGYPERQVVRSEERRVGKEWVRTGRS